MKKYLVIKEFIKLSTWTPDVFLACDTYENANDVANAMNLTDTNHKYWVFEMSK